MKGNNSSSASKLAAFDMDGTLIDGRLVFALSEKFGLENKVKDIQASKLPGHEQTKEIAHLFQGLAKKDIESAIESIPLAKNCESTISRLREMGYRMGIISDSYTIASGFVADRLELDFVAANKLEIKDDSVVTGRVEMPLGWEKIGCFCKISVCKRFHLEKYAREFGIRMEDTVATGDTKSDVCMIKAAGLGIAYMPKDETVAHSTASVVREPDFSRVLEFIHGSAEKS